MTVETNVTAQQMGHVLAEAAKNEPRAVEIWVATRPDAVHLWLITAPITTEEHRRLYLLNDVLYAHFPDAAFQLHVRNPRNYRGDVRHGLPRDAEQVAFSPAHA